GESAASRGGSERPSSPNPPRERRLRSEGSPGSARRVPRTERSRWPPPPPGRWWRAAATARPGASLLKERCCHSLSRPRFRHKELNSNIGYARGLIQRERRKTTVKTLCIYADYKSDESYTPSKISVRVGNNFHNLQEIRQLELVEPSGWIHVPLTDTHKKPIRTFMIQIAVLANHQNGRDTHMRQIKVYTPVEESSIGKFPRCTTIDFMMYRSIR
uniref:Anaphase-promoting complex subunit 10 n=1 Tax=Ficedula albicollis TaxID=59894 RepID=A0A803W2M5_FICAL